MPSHIYEKLELTGSSTLSSDDAINNAIASAAQTHKNLRWFEVIESRGDIDNNKVSHWQVTIKVGITRDS